MTAYTSWYKDFVATPTEDWKIKQLVILSLLDSPHYGFVEFSNPVGTFYFRLTGQQAPSNQDGMDECLFQLHDAPSDAVSNLIDELRYLHPVRTPIWAPIWRFPSEELRNEAEAAVNALIDNTGEAKLLVQSKNMHTFTQLWRLW